MLVTRLDPMELVPAMAGREVLGQNRNLPRRRTARSAHQDIWAAVEVMEKKETLFIKVKKKCFSLFWI